MPKKLTAAKIKSQNKLVTYLRRHPYVTTGDLWGTKLYNALIFGYDGRITEARKDANITETYNNFRKEQTERTKREKEERARNRIRTYLAKNSDATDYEIQKAGLGHALDIGYDQSINKARKDIGSKPKRVRIPRELRRQRLVAHLIENPNVTSGDLWGTELYVDLHAAYDGRINDARRDARREVLFKRLERKANTK